MSERQTCILLAEDDHVISVQVKEIATALGYAVVEHANTGMEAIGLTETLAPDVVLVDIDMPDMDGLDIARQIMACRPTPIVVLTPYDMPNLFAEATMTGVAAYVVKPPQHCELARAIALARIRFEELQELRQFRAQAEAAVKARDTLFALIAHDLRNPVSAISGYNQLATLSVQESTDQTTRDEALSYLAGIEMATTRMLRQLEEYLDVARIRGGQELILDLGPADLVTLVRQAVVDAQRTAPNRRILISTSDSALIGEFDQMRISRVITNLLNNAIRYSPNDTAVLLTIAYAQEDGMPGALLSVRDEGVGIPPEELPMIFEPFTRAQNVQGRARGIGLGLASVRQIVAQHGGAINVVSNPGQGSTFTIWLPLRRQPMIETAPVLRGAVSVRC